MQIASSYPYLFPQKNPLYLVSIFIFIFQISLTSKVLSAPVHQGWINYFQSSGFFSDISSVCPVSDIEIDGYGAGIHRCRSLPITMSDSVGWGWVCPKMQSSQPFTDVYACNPNLDATSLATCTDGTVMVGVAQSHPFGSNIDDAGLNACFNQQPNQPTLDLSGPTTVAPSGGPGNSSATLTARVNSSQGPLPSIPLNFTVTVTPSSGSHEHHDNNRPKGDLSVASGMTNESGEFKFTFKAPEVSGIHTISVTCNACTNQTERKDIQVKVPDLLPISPNPPQNADGNFVYALTSVDITHAGNGRYHHNQYYLTDQSRQNLRALIDAFAAEGWGTVALNDASLLWGGRYDIRANWSGPHAGHREGREIDISFARAQNPVAATKQNSFYKKFCEAKTVQVPFSLLHHYVQNPHFHVYLEKQTACWTSEK